MISQIRTVPGAETPDGKLAWSPQLDLRNCGIDALRRALPGVMAAHWEPWFGDYLRLSGLGDAELGPATVAFADGVGRFLRAEVADLGDGLRQAGFFDQPGPCQLALFGRLGQCYLGHFAHAIRHCHGDAADGVPYQAALDRLLADGRAIADALAAAPEDDAGRLGLGLQALRPYQATGTLHPLAAGGLAIDCRDVPAAVAGRLQALGWTQDPEVSDDRVVGAIVWWKFRPKGS